ncbi:YkyA family protein [Sporosarcina soli]|uniref:YkyA family protein n=1 Tax=Sporosarcina soli TaxID=334736 RepID=A0ABW0TGN9_9BACL
MKPKLIYVLVISAMLAGCDFGSSADEQLKKVIDELNHMEMDYREAQETVFEYEQQEQQLFNETMELTKDRQEELAAKVAELKKLLGQRLAFLEKEEASIQEAKKSAMDLDNVLDDDDENNKKMIEQLKSVVNERYELHDAFVSEYKKLTTLQNELYEMLIDNRTGLSRLNEQVKEVNVQKEEVQSAISIFNEATTRVNALLEDIEFN